MVDVVTPRKECAVGCRLCPDVVEWCPAPAHEDLLVYGLYEFDEASGERRGALRLARAAPAEDGAEGHALCEGAELEMAGVYDVAWGPCSLQLAAFGPEAVPLAAASADGALRLLAVGGGCELTASLLDQCQLLEGAILTHVTWGAAGPDGLAAVGQDGTAHHVQAREDGRLCALAHRKAHELEAWCVEASPEQPFLLLTGADDGQLLGWDLREPPDATPAVSNRRSHEAGVTALAHDPLAPHRVASGSYDERVRLFDLRAAAKAPIAESARLGDGAYHLAWHPCWSNVLAVAAMRSGLPLLRAEGAGFVEWGRYAADAPEGSHGSLAYGVSWRQSPGLPAGHWLVASASFYDRSLHLWASPEPPP